MTGLLLAILLFLLFAVAIGLRSGRRFGPPLPRLDRERLEPVLVAQLTGALCVLGAVLAFAGDVRPLGSALLAISGGCLVYAGVKITANEAGEADRFAERHWHSQNIFVRHPPDEARKTAAGQAILGGFLLLVALLALGT